MADKVQKHRVPQLMALMTKTVSYPSMVVRSLKIDAMMVKMEKSPLWASTLAALLHVLVEARR